MNNDIDPWDCAINDENFYINNKIARIFPLLKNSTCYNKLKIDDESFSYITIREIADLITKVICHHLMKFNINPQKVNIVDYTAGVGGNVLSFVKYFNHVTAIESCALRASYLKNNVEIYGFKNITIINDTSINYHNNELIMSDTNVVFVDPPWGGSSYKDCDELLQLKLDNISMENLFIDIVKKYSEYYFHKEKFINILQQITSKHNIIQPTKVNKLYNKYDIKYNKVVVFKLPKNYDIENFYSFIKAHSSYYTNYIIRSYVYILNKMIIVVCDMCYMPSLINN